jgi:hypothetical protein
MVITEFLYEPANTEIETEMSTYKYLNANTAI